VFLLQMDLLDWELADPNQWQIKVSAIAFNLNLDCIRVGLTICFPRYGVF
jgi:hypothetical protein